MANNLLTDLYVAWLMEEDSTADRTDSHTRGLDLIMEPAGILNRVAGISSFAVDFQGNSANTMQRVDDGNFEFGDNSFSMTAWVQGATNGNDPYIAKRNKTGNNRGFLLEHRISKPRFLMSSDGINETLVTSVASVAGAPTWNIVAAGFDKVTGQIWIQIGGQTRITANHTGGLFDGTAALQVGWHDPGTSAEVIGSHSQDETYLWERYLTVEDVDTMWDGGTGLFFSSFDTGVSVAVLSTPYYYR